MIWLLSSLLSVASADALNAVETSYTGATILQGDTDVWFANVTDANYEHSDYAYGFFEGNTLYVGNSDQYGNSIDAIVEFFWFQSSIDRGSDFYVGVVKVRATPGRDCPWYFGSSDCELWADDLFDWGEYPVVSVEAITDVSREQGAFRWDWAVPFENYGIDAYGQVSISNRYGIGANASAGAEGSAMTALSLPEGTNINGVPVNGSAQGSAEIQSKGYLNSEFMVQTQYETTLYEWDVFVNGRADLMAWDTYLNLGVRANQSAYYEYFLPIQVETGHNFYMDQFNFVSNFDIGNINPFAYELGLSLQGVEIAPPFYEEPEEEPEPSSEPTEEPIEEPEEEDTAVPDQEDTGDSEASEDRLELDGDTPERVKAGCNSIDKAVWLSLLVIPFILRRRE